MKGLRDGNGWLEVEYGGCTLLEVKFVKSVPSSLAISMKAAVSTNLFLKQRSSKYPPF